MSRSHRLHWWEELEESTNKQIQKAVDPKGKKRQSTKAPKIRIPTCTHWRQPFELQEGLRVYASAWMDRPHQEQVLPAAGFRGDPDVGFYLDSRWGSDLLLVSPGTTGPFTRMKRSSTKVVVFPWPDYGVPRDAKVLWRCLDWILKQVEAGKIVEIGCIGGHGRTGSVLAALLVHQGMTSEGAIRRVWRRYCEEAIESQRQIAFLNGLSDRSQNTK